jgi:hypothetical protein
VQRLNQLWNLVNAASTVRDIATHTKTYHFAVPDPNRLTFYLQTESAAVQIIRWARPLIELTTHLQGAFGWRVLTEQDTAGVYVAAGRRTLVGGLSSAAFEVRVPAETYCILKLDGCDLSINNINGEVRVPPLADSGTLLLESGDT